MTAISNRHARHHLMTLTGLTGGDQAAQGQDPAAIIGKLGFVQVDSINVLERAHHHILFSRQTGYRPTDLARSVEQERSLFENWTHDASIIPSAFFPYWRHRFAREKASLRQRWKRHFATEHFDDDIARVVERITRDGPVMARDFESNKSGAGWWDWHPSKAALEYLWRTGDLAITRREGFQKVYDLSERVIPLPYQQAEIDHDGFVDWACREALKRLGFATRGEIAAFWALLTPTEVDQWIAANRGILQPVKIETVDGGKLRAALSLEGTVEEASKAAEPSDTIRILSPFDPLMRDRARVERLFGFSYRIEIFVPQAKRRYSYYVYPVLRGDVAVGRIDVKAERERDALVVQALWLEPGIRPSKLLTRKLEAELERLRRFAGLSHVEFADNWLKPA